MKLTKVVEVDQEKCVNCHRCIAVCPVKYCNYSSVDSVAMHKDLCIGCGECLRVCTHNARITAIVTVKVSEWVERTTKVTKEIASMIEQIRKDAEEAVTSMQQETKKIERGKAVLDKAGQSLASIISGSEKIVI